MTGYLKTIVNKHDFIERYFEFLKEDDSANSSVYNSIGEILNKKSDTWTGIVNICEGLSQYISDDPRFDNKEYDNDWIQPIAGAHVEVKKRLLAEFDLQAAVTLPKGMFEPYTPTPTCVLIFQKTGKPTKEAWFYRVEGDGSSLRKARKFGPQFRNDFPDLLAKWPKRKTEDGRAWRVPAAKIIANGYNLTLASLGLVEAERIDHAEPEDILASVAEKEQRILEIVQEMRKLVTEAAP